MKTPLSESGVSRFIAFLYPAEKVSKSIMEIIKPVAGDSLTGLRVARQRDS